MSVQRKADIARTTTETDITVALTIDGTGQSTIKTGVGFLDHMLTLFSKHGFFDISVACKGDIEVDLHHTNEDVAICLGDAFKQALGEKKGIVRYGTAYVPMDDALVRIVLDISNRPYCLVSGIAYTDVERDDYYYADMKHFMQSFAQSCGVNVHVDVIRGDDKHHIIEAAFKGLAKAMDQATQYDSRQKGIPSTKGCL